MTRHARHLLRMRRMKRARRRWPWLDQLKACIWTMPATGATYVYRGGKWSLAKDPGAPPVPPDPA